MKTKIFPVILLMTVIGFFSGAKMVKAVTYDQCYSAYSDCYNKATDDASATTCENTLHTCENSATDKADYLIGMIGSSCGEQELGICTDFVPVIAGGPCKDGKIWSSVSKQWTHCDQGWCCLKNAASSGKCGDGDAGTCVAGSMGICNSYGGPATGGRNCPSGEYCCKTASSATNSGSEGAGRSAPRCASLGGTCGTLASCNGKQAITGSDNDCSGGQYCCSAASGGSVAFTNPLQFNTVEGLLGTILSAVQKIIVTLALVFIVIGAVMIVVSAGNSGMVENGKKAITMALVGLAVGIAAPSILKELAGVLGWGAGANIQAPTLTQIGLNVLNFLLGIAGLLSLIMMVIGATMYLTSAGSEDQIDNGKNIFKYATIGIFMAMASMVIVHQIAVFFAQ